MLVLIRRSCTIPSITVVFCLFIVILVMAKQLKDIYEQSKKNQRFQLYNSFLNEVSDSMMDLENNINKSFANLHQLNAMLEKQKSSANKNKNPQRPV